MNRLDFYKTVSVDNVDECDFLNNNLSKFVMKRQPSYYTVIQSDLRCPDVISWKMYGTEYFWWLLCLINDVLSPLVDIKAGMTLEVPNIVDIHDFYHMYSQA